VYFYGMQSYDRTIEEPPCEQRVAMLRDPSSVTDLEQSET
jgi:hypothetical protein